MSLEFLKTLLEYPFYEKHKAVLYEDLVHKDYQDIYRTIIKAHEANKVSLSVNELKALHESFNSTMSVSKKQALELLYKKLEETINFDIAIQEQILHNKLIEKISIEISSFAMDIADNKDKPVDQLQILLDKLKKLKNKSISESNAIIDINEIFNGQEELKWKFNLHELQERLSGIGPGYFGIVAARPDAGKTGFYISLAASVGGWLEQGAKVHIIGNEEAPRRIKQRIIASATGWTKEYILEHKNEAIAIWDRIKNNCFVQDGFGMTMGALDNYASTHEIDILIIDQLDKMGLNGKFGTNEERLRAVYIQAREIAKKYNCGVIGICQASFAAHNKLHFGFECLEGSKTGKAAECDWCITIGMETDARGEDNYYRMANIPKNKLTGKKSPVSFILEPDISRIHA